MSELKELNERLDKLIESEKERAIQVKEIHDQIKNQLDEINVKLKEQK